jgi:SMC interacting uncharacterized protein involved in chromosome segregation
MGLLDLFSRLVVEHGSAEVQSKHIALFKDQLALADKRILELESENATFESKLGNAETTIQELTKENEILRRKIQEYEQPPEQPTHGNLLDESKINILKLLFKQDNLQTEQIAQSLNIELQITKFHLEEMKADIGLIKRASISVPRVEHLTDGIINHFDRVPVWTIGQKGRKYLIDNCEV